MTRITPNPHAVTPERSLPWEEIDSVCESYNDTQARKAGSNEWFWITREQANYLRMKSELENQTERSAPQNDESQNVARIEWDGEEYPPVGARCEYFDGGEWMPCEVVAHRKGGWAVLSDDLEADFVTLEALRPVRTPEQVAEEKRHKETHEWLEKISIDYGLATSVECYKILLAAGLRRP